MIAEAHMSAQSDESQPHMYLAIFRRTSKRRGGEDERIVYERAVAVFSRLEPIPS